MLLCDDLLFACHNWLRHGLEVRLATQQGRCTLGVLHAYYFSATQAMILSLVGANTAGHTKKAVTAGLVWGSYSTSNGIAPLLVKTTEKQRHYPSAFIPIMAMMTLTFVLLGIYRIYMLHLNRKKDRVMLVDMNAAARTGFLDITDTQNENFRYQA